MSLHKHLCGKSLHHVAILVGVYGFVYGNVRLWGLVSDSIWITLGGNEADLHPIKKKKLAQLQSNVSGTFSGPTVGLAYSQPWFSFRGFKLTQGIFTSETWHRWLCCVRRNFPISSWLHSIQNQTRIQTHRQKGHTCTLKTNPRWMPELNYEVLSALSEGRHLHSFMWFIRRLVPKNIWNCATLPSPAFNTTLYFLTLFPSKIKFCDSCVC